MAVVPRVFLFFYWVLMVFSAVFTVDFYGVARFFWVFFSFLFFSFFFVARVFIIFPLKGQAAEIALARNVTKLRVGFVFIQVKTR